MLNTKGFTLIELLIAMLVTMIILGGAYAVFNTQQRQTTIQTNVSDAQQNLRAAMDFLSREVRMAGYNPEQTTANFGISDIQFRDIDDNNDATGNSYICFSWDQDSDGVLDNDETIDISLVNSATITPGVSDLFLRRPNVSTDRNVLASNIIAIGLAYAIDSDSDGELEQDGAGNTLWLVDADNDRDWDSLNINTGTTADIGTAVDTRAIRAVRIWMLSQAQAPDPNYIDPNTYIVGSHVVIPNNNFRHRILERIILCRNMGLD